jgi:hypothetical protein
MKNKFKISLIIILAITALSSNGFNSNANNPVNTNPVEKTKNTFISKFSFSLISIKYLEEFLSSSYVGNNYKLNKLQ